jgi:MFS family permease
VTLEAEQSGKAAPTLSGGAQFIQTSFRDPNLSSACQAGLVNNLNDAMAWGLLPLFFLAAGLPLSQVGILSAAYPAVWGIGQLATGWASDRLGRKWLIAAGMAVQAAAIGLIAFSHSFGLWLGEAVLLGVGTAMVYPTLLAAVGDASHPTNRASAIGVYRF